MKYTLGLLIKTTREGKGIGRDILAEGIMSERNLVKVENNEIVLDKITWDFFLSRLGISTSIYECYVTKEEFICYEFQTKLRNIANDCIRFLYERKENREKILKSIKQGIEYSKQYQVFLQENKRMEGCYPPIHLFFIGVMEFYFLKASGESVVTRKKHLIHTWKILHSISIEEMLSKKKHCFSLQELECLLLWSDICFEEGEKEKAVELLNWICDYCENYYLEDKIKIYPYAMWYLSKIKLKENKKEEAFQIAMKSVELLLSKKSLRCLIPLIDLLLEVKSFNGGTWYTEEQLQEYKGCILELCREYEENPYAMYPFTSIEQATLVSEIICQRRKYKCMTQAQLSEGIVEPETLSRFEREKISMRWKKTSLILGRLGLPQEKEQLLLETDSYQALEMYQEINNHIFKFQTELAKEKLYILDNKLDKSSIKNKQYVKFVKTIIQKSNYQIHSLEIQEKIYIELLQMTKPKYPDISIEHELLSRCEGGIINGLGILYEKKGDIERGKALLEQGILSYENKLISRKYSNRSRELLKHNYASLLGELGMFETAIKISKGEIKIILCKGAIEGVASALYEVAWNLYEWKKDEREIKKYYIQALTTAKLEQDGKLVRFLLEREGKYLFNENLYL